MTMHTPFPSPTHDGLPLSPLLADFRAHLLAAGRTAGTVKVRLNHLTRLEVTHPDLLVVSTHQLEAHFATLALAGQAAETRKAWRSSVQAFYGWALEAGRITADPAARLKAIRVPPSVSRSCPDTAVIAALADATTAERAAILLGRYAGLRLTEIATLHTRHFDGRVLRVTGKGGKQRVVPVVIELAAALNTLATTQGDGYYFPGRLSGHIHPHSLNKILTARLGWNPHSLRHAAATAAYRSSRNLRAVQAFLGHSSIATTQRYIGVDLDEVSAAIEGAVIRIA